MNELKIGDWAICTCHGAEGIIGLKDSSGFVLFNNKHHGIDNYVDMAVGKGFKFVHQPGDEKLVKKENKMESLKQYLEKHRDAFFTIGIVLVLDHFVFAGAFREKLKQMVDSILDKKTKAITDGK